MSFLEDWVAESGAHDRDRTGDLVLTKDVLYRLSYVSVEPDSSAPALAYVGAGNGIRTRDFDLGKVALYH